MQLLSTRAKVGRLKMGSTRFYFSCSQGRQGQDCFVGANTIEPRLAPIANRRKRERETCEGVFPCMMMIGLVVAGRPKEALIYSAFVAIPRCEQKNLLTYCTYVASIFFVRALSRLELGINQSFPKRCDFFPMNVLCFKIHLLAVFFPLDLVA